MDQSLLIARAEQGRLVPQRSVFNLTTAVTEVVGDFQLLAAEQNRRFTLKADEDCWVAADPRHLRQIIHTLLTNALKHGGGDLSVRLTKHSRHTVLLVANRVNRAPDRETTLGLGLRVVAALLRLEPEVQLQRRHGKNHYATRLRLPTVEQSLGFHI